MKYILLLSILFLSSCDLSIKYKIGQKVSNGPCKGYITSTHQVGWNVWYGISELNCGDMKMNYAIFDQDAIVEVLP